MVKTRCYYTVRASCSPVVIVFLSPSSFDRVYYRVHIWVARSRLNDDSSNLGVDRNVKRCR
uniref:Uncharacterized protein n=1 Tax=Oryza punctata TaxID=4537 RepID=A0A0E0K3C7_ORYPU